MSGTEAHGRAGAPAVLAHERPRKGPPAVLDCHHLFSLPPIRCWNSQQTDKPGFASGIRGTGLTCSHREQSQGIRTRACRPCPRCGHSHGGQSAGSSGGHHQHTGPVGWRGNDRKASLALARQEAARLLELVSGLTDYARIREGTAAFHAEHFNLARLWNR
jgi:hypothetical protein